MERKLSKSSLLSMLSVYLPKQQFTFHLDAIVVTMNYLSSENSTTIVQEYGLYDPELRKLYTSFPEREFQNEDDLPEKLIRKIDDLKEVDGLTLKRIVHKNILLEERIGRGVLYRITLPEDFRTPWPSRSNFRMLTALLTIGFNYELWHMAAQNKLLKDLDAPKQLEAYESSYPKYRISALGEVKVDCENMLVDLLAKPKMRGEEEAMEFKTCQANMFNYLVAIFHKAVVEEGSYAEPDEILGYTHSHYTIGVRRYLLKNHVDMKKTKVERGKEYRQKYRKLRPMLKRRLDFLERAGFVSVERPYLEFYRVTGTSFVDKQGNRLFLPHPSLLKEVQKDIWRILDRSSMSVKLELA